MQLPVLIHDSPEAEPPELVGPGSDPNDQLEAPMSCCSVGHGRRVWICVAHDAPLINAQLPQLDKPYAKALLGRTRSLRQALKRFETDGDMPGLGGLQGRLGEGSRGAPARSCPGRRQRYRHRKLITLTL